jgi:UMF1 family MFS transporter
MVRAWVMYDWANSAFVTTVLTAVFPIYFQDVAAAGLDRPAATARFAAATTVALVVMAVASPVLGALADATAVRKRLLAVFVAAGVAATAGLFFVREGDWLLGLGLFALGNVGAAGSFVFYDSLLPHVAAPRDLDRVSAIGYALGYLGGGLVLAVNLAWIERPELFGLADGAAAARVSFLSVALWWALFSIPILWRVPEPPRQLEAGERHDESALRLAVGRLRRTMKALGEHRQAFLFLLAMLIYQDAITTIQRMAAIYGREIGLPGGSLIGAILMVQFIGVPCAWLFGNLALWIGTKRAILLGLGVFLLACVLGYRMTTTTEFFVLAGLVGLVQGGTQALSRSLYASMVPPQRSSEFFGFFGMASKLAGLFGPAIFGAVTAATGSSRYAILSVGLSFVIGALLVACVDVEEGRRAALRSESELGS